MDTDYISGLSKHLKWKVVGNLISLHIEKWKGFTFLSFPFRESNEALGIIKYLVRIDESFNHTSKVTPKDVVCRLPRFK